MSILKSLLVVVCCSAMVGHGSSEVTKLNDLEDGDLRAIRSCFAETKKLTGSKWVYNGIPVNSKINRIMFVEAPSGDFLKLELDIYPPLFDGASFTCGMDKRDLSVAYTSYVNGVDVENYVVSQTLLDRLDDSFNEGVEAPGEKIYLVKSWRLVKERIEQLED